MSFAQSAIFVGASLLLVTGGCEERPNSREAPPSPVETSSPTRKAPPSAGDWMLEAARLREEAAEVEDDGWLGADMRRRDEAADRNANARVAMASAAEDAGDWLAPGEDKVRLSRVAQPPAGASTVTATASPPIGSAAQFDPSLERDRAEVMRATEILIKNRQTLERRVEKRTSVAAQAYAAYASQCAMVVEQTAKKVSVEAADILREFAVGQLIEAGDWATAEAIYNPSNQQKIKEHFTRAYLRIEKSALP